MRRHLPVYLLTPGAMMLLAPLCARVYAQHDSDHAPSVVFYSTRDGHPNNQIYVMNPDGRNPVRLTYEDASGKGISHEEQHEQEDERRRA